VGSGEATWEMVEQINEGLSKIPHWSINQHMTRKLELHEFIYVTSAVPTLPLIIVLVTYSYFQIIRPLSKLSLFVVCLLVERNCYQIRHQSYYRGGVGRETIHQYVQTTMHKKQTENWSNIMKIAVSILCSYT
jgi:hypothetical protein